MTESRWSDFEPADPRLWKQLRRTEKEASWDYSFRANLLALVKGQTMLVVSPTPDRMLETKRRYAKELAECKGTVKFVVPDGLPGQLGSN